MAAVAEDRRITELRRLGASESLIRLATGECVHDTFRNGCLGPPYYVYHGAATPDGPPLVALWDCNDTVVGVWERVDGPEFIEFSIEAVDEYRSLARTEQGLWATQFNFLYECEVSVDELREAAATVGFRFLVRYLTSREAAESRLGTFETHGLWLRGLVAGIDREASEAEQDAPPDRSGD